MPKAKLATLTDTEKIKRIRDLIDQAEAVAFDKFFRGGDRAKNLAKIEAAYFAFIQELFPAGSYCPPGTTLKGGECVPD